MKKIYKIMVSIAIIVMISSIGMAANEVKEKNLTNETTIDENDIPASIEQKELTPPTKEENKERLTERIKNAENLTKILENPKAIENIAIGTIPTYVTYTNPVTGISNFGTYLYSTVYTNSYTQWFSYSFYLPTASYVYIDYSGRLGSFADYLYYDMYVDTDYLNSGYDDIAAPSPTYSNAQIQTSRSTYLSKGWHTIYISGYTDMPGSYYYTYGYLSIIAFPEYTAITVTAPNGGETWYRGNTKTISWKKDGNPGANVKIELYKGSTLSTVISSKTPNDGSYSWYIPTYLPTGTDYKIKITSYEEPTKYYDWSNNNFKIY